MNFSKCPFKSQMARANTDNDHFFPERLNLAILNQKNQNSPLVGKPFDYASAFSSLDLNEVKHDIKTVLTVSQPWWPADYGNYAPFMVRMAWHVAGTYRAHDGRGGGNTGNQRFAPLNSWPDNGNLDKARRLLWPVKQKYGQKLSWADLFMLTGNVALEIIGCKPFGFGGGREDIFASEIDTYWGPETKMLTDSRHEKVGEIHEPLGASEMGLSKCHYQNVKSIQAKKYLLVGFRLHSYSHNEYHLAIFCQQSTSTRKVLVEIQTPSRLPRKSGLPLPI